MVELLHAVANSASLVNSQNTHIIPSDRINDSVIADSNTISLIPILDLLVEQSRGLLESSLSISTILFLITASSPSRNFFACRLRKNLVHHSSENFSPLSIFTSISSSFFSYSSLSSSNPMKLSSLLFMTSSCLSILCRCSRIAFSCILNNLLAEVDKVTSLGISQLL